MKRSNAWPAGVLKSTFGTRDETKAMGALAKLTEEGLCPGNGQVLWFSFDFSDPRLAKKAAEEFLKRETRLDILSMLSLIIASAKTLINSFYSQQRRAVSNDFSQTLTDG
jgi:hypothetical protein